MWISGTAIFDMEPLRRYHYEALIDIRDRDNVELHPNSALAAEGLASQLRLEDQDAVSA